MKLRLSIIIILVFVLSGAMTGLFSRKMMDFFLWYDPEAVTGYRGADIERYGTELMAVAGMDVATFVQNKVPLGGVYGSFLPSFAEAEGGEIVEGKMLLRGEKFHNKKVYDETKGRFIIKRVLGESKAVLDEGVARRIQRVVNMYREGLRRTKYEVATNSDRLPSNKEVVSKLNDIVMSIIDAHRASKEKEVAAIFAKIAADRAKTAKVSTFTSKNGLADSREAARDFQRRYVRTFSKQIAASTKARTAGIIAQAVVAIQCAKNIDVDTMSIKAAITEVANAYEIEARQLLGSTYVLDPEFMEGLKDCTQAYARAFVEGRRASATEEALAVGRARLKNALRKNR